MGAPSYPSWPRGLPLEQIKATNLDKLPLVNVDIPKSKISVIQSLANGDPDVDAIYRLTQPLTFSFPQQYKGGNLNIPKGDASDEKNSKEGRVDPKKYIHPLRTPLNTYAPYNAQATLHMHNALWSLLLPVTVHGRVSDIWRGYFAQKVFAKMGTHLLFSPPIVRQDRNVHRYEITKEIASLILNPFLFYIFVYLTNTSSRNSFFYCSN